ncbi:xylulose kinase-like [Dorcoceras hygrometricum]|uniref:Xylulose kinase-like n=1 Tax=Dorcoceras hygrometricum TaxID=472368 RepID=A0A2Z7CXX3_9LAMI|nr:xylulose kinase-like [Dorcoceras hygrometricum]
MKSHSLKSSSNAQHIELSFHVGIVNPVHCVTLNGSGIQLVVAPQPLWLRNRNFGLAQLIMVKRLETSPHDPLGITDSAYKNQLVVVSVQYGPFNTYILIKSTTIGISRVARDPIAMHTSCRSYSDIASVTGQTHLPKTHSVLWPEIYHTIISSDSIGYPRVKASGESSTTKHRPLHASGPHPIPPPNDPKIYGKDNRRSKLEGRAAYERVGCPFIFVLLVEPLGSLAFLVQVSPRRSRWEVEFEPVAAC